MQKQIPDADIIIATSWETAEVLDNLWKSRKNFRPVYFIQHIETWDYYNTGVYSTIDYLALNTYTLPYPKIITSDWIGQYVHGDYKVPMGIEPVPDIPEEEWRNPFFNEIPYITGILRGIPWKGDDILVELGEIQPINIFKNLSNEYLDRLLWRTDIFLSASLVEGFNLPVLEAMAHGCCCVTTNTGAIPEYSDCGSGVVLVEERTPDAFCRVLDDLRSRPEEIRRIGRKARKLAEQWTIQRTVDEFEKVLNDIR